VTENLLELRDIEVTYLGAIVAIQNVTIEVGPSEFVVILGANGAGKTTTLRAVSGFVPADHAQLTHGSVWFEGQEISGLPPHKIARQGVSIVPEREKVFRTLTVEENLRCVITREQANRTDLTHFIHELFPILETRRNQVAGYLSGGQIQMLAIARALLSGPKILMPDEVSLGLAPVLVEEIIDALRRINIETGLGTLLVEQNAGSALQVAHRAYVLSTGRIVFEGKPEELRNNPLLADVYVGAAAE
jgi:branched-chain amino acid transport system ATP-binding protein